MNGPGTLPRGRNTQQSKRADRYHARSVLWGESSLKRVRACGRVLANTAAGASVRVHTDPLGVRSAGFGGVQRCGSASSCPVCSARIAEVRRQDIASAIRAWDARGGVVAMVTLTVRHRLGQPLAALWDSIGAAWTLATSGRAWRADERRYGSPLSRIVNRAGGPRVQLAYKIPSIRVVENTHGVAGWHPHVHALLFLPAGTTQSDVDRIFAGMVHRWSRRLQRDGFEAPLAVGVSASLVASYVDVEGRLGDYFAKQSLYRSSAEIASGMQSKLPKRGNRTPFMILADLVRSGDAADLDLWHEWERASHGRRVVQWSLGLRDFLLLGSEVTDQEIVDEELDGETVAVLDPEEWYRLLREDLALDLLEAFEASDVAGADWLALWRAFGGLAPPALVA